MNTPPLFCSYPPAFSHQPHQICSLPFHPPSAAVFPPKSQLRPPTHHPPSTLYLASRTSIALSDSTRQKISIQVPVQPAKSSISLTASRPSNCSGIPRCNDCLCFRKRHRDAAEAWKAAHLGRKSLPFHFLLEVRALLTITTSTSPSTCSLLSRLLCRRCILVFLDRKAEGGLMCAILRLY